MARWTRTDLDPTTVGGTELANDYFDPAMEALFSQHLGAGDPASPASGMLYWDDQTTYWSMKVWDGSGSPAEGVEIIRYTLASQAVEFMGTITVADNAISDAKLRDSAALSVIGRSANSSGNPADIAASSDGDVLRRSGTAIGFGSITTASISDFTSAVQALAAVQSVNGRIGAVSLDTDAIPEGNAKFFFQDRAWDAIGAILGGTATIDFTYGGSPVGITADVKSNSISDSLIRDSAALSVIGRASNSTGDPADITAGSDGYVLRRSGTTLAFGEIATAGIADDAVTYAKIQNVSATDRILGRDTAGSGNIEELTVSGGLEFTGTGIQRSALTGDVTATAGSNATTIAADAVTDTKLRNSAALSVIGRGANSTGDPADIAAGSDGYVLRRSGTTLAFGQIAAGAIPNDLITYAMMQNVSATSRVLGRTTAGAGDVEELTGAQVAAFMAAADLAGIIAIAPPQGRLTLTSGTPVTVSDVTAATSVYYALYTGERVPIFNGTVFVPTVFTELTQALASNSGYTNYHQSGRNFDHFVINDSGTIRLGTGPKWNDGAVSGSDTARGTGANSTELELYKGVWVNKNAITIRWGSASGNTVAVSARQATYVGTSRMTADGQTEDSLTKRFVWNAYNRVHRAMQRLEGTNSWTYSTASFRQANNSALNQLDMVRGLNEDEVYATATGHNASSGATLRQVATGIGLDSTTVASGIIANFYTAVGTAGLRPHPASYRGFPGLGYHYLAWLELGGGADTQTWYGDAGAPTVLQSGMVGGVIA